METKTQKQQQQTKISNKNNNMKRSSSTNSESHTHFDSSPLRFHSPLQSDHGDPPETPPYSSPAGSPQKPQPKPLDNSKAIVAVDKFTQYSPLQSPIPPPEKPQPQPQPQRQPPPPLTVNMAVRGEVGQGMKKVGPGEGRSGSVAAIVSRTRREKTVKMAALGFRLSEVVLCLISFSVLAADKTQGWSGDSFDRYKEYRYCLSVNVIAFAYSGFQAYDLAYHLATGKHVIRRHHLRRHFDFFMDQILAYLLISASSSAATRVDDWQSNWGKDEFTEMASASVAMAFLAFIAFAISSLISGYNLCTLDST